MAREFAKKFYKSSAWQKCREYIFKRDDGLCQDCLKKSRIEAGKEVHHIEFLNESNINDPAIALGEDKLILLCKECHHARHTKRINTREGFYFNEDGELVSYED